MRAHPERDADDLASRERRRRWRRSGCGPSALGDATPHPSPACRDSLGAGVGSEDRTYAPKTLTTASAALCSQDTCVALTAVVVTADNGQTVSGAWACKGLQQHTRCRRPQQCHAVEDVAHTNAVVAVVAHVVSGARCDHALENHRRRRGDVDARGARNDLQPISALVGREAQSGTPRTAEETTFDSEYAEVAPSLPSSPLGTTAAHTRTSVVELRRDAA